MPRTARGGEEAPIVVTHLVPPGSLSESAFGPSLHPHSRQGSGLRPRGSCYLSPGQGCRQDPDNPGKKEQMAFFSPGLGVAAAPSPTAARGPGRLPARVQLRSQGVTVTAGSQEVGAGVSETTFWASILLF